MTEFVNKRCVLFLVLVIFTVCKVPHLSAPYYWDESWPYAPAIKAMQLRGISLLPNAIDPELSRGHPLFFHVIAAAWMNVFGGSHLAMHSFALVISLLFVILIFEAGLALFNQRVATMALLLVATQVCFFVQSSFVLFEMLVALLAFLALYTFSIGKYLLTGSVLTALFYTKESGLVAGAVLGVAAFIGLFDKKIPVRQRIYSLLSVAIPFLLTGIFFVLQKHLNGWYIFPFYADIIEHSWKAFWYKFRMGCVRDTFYSSLKFWYFVVLLVMTLVAAAVRRNARYLVIFLPAACIYYFVNDMRAGRLLPPVPFFIVFIASVAWFLKVFSSSAWFPAPGQRKFIVLSGSFVFCFLCFSTMNYLTYRYLLAAIVPLLFLASIFFDLLVRQSYKPLFYPVAGLLLVISCCSFAMDDDYGDVNLGAFKAMKLQQFEVDFMEQHARAEDAIASGSFLVREHLKDPATGFLHKGKVFTNVRWDIDTATRYAIFDNIETDMRHDQVIHDTAFHLAGRMENGKKWAEVYNRW